MSYFIPKVDVNTELSMIRPPDFNRRSTLMKTDKLYECVITNIVQLTEKEKLFELKILDPQEAKLFSFLPGQFVMLELPGFGEVPISISSSNSHRAHIGLCIRKVGKVTGMLHRAKQGSKVGIRGPFGTHFPMEQMVGHNILLIAGGLGLAPLRAPIYWVNEHRSDYKNVSIMYGTRDPAQILFEYEFAVWSKVYNYDIHITVDVPSEGWQGKVGLITELFKEVEIDPNNTFAIVCGPPVMFKFVCRHLNEIGIPMHRMFVSLERRMHCGMGKCCRCMVGSTFTCLDGPVMDYWTVMNLKEAI
jgi:sulfhydrogenase subunit gamma (sulfur reductase)